jgi:hypothetical protein
MEGSDIATYASTKLAMPTSLLPLSSFPHTTHDLGRNLGGRRRRCLACAERERKRRGGRKNSMATKKVREGLL